MFTVAFTPPTRGASTLDRAEGQRADGDHRGLVGVPLYTASQTAPPGHYRRVDGDGDGERIVVLERIDILPASRPCRA